MSEVRVGYVSSIDYENGLCEIHYPDRDDTVTEMVPWPPSMMKAMAVMSSPV